VQADCECHGTSVLHVRVYSHLALVVYVACVMCIEHVPQLWGYVGLPLIGYNESWLANTVALMCCTLDASLGNEALLLLVKNKSEGSMLASTWHGCNHKRHAHGCLLRLCKCLGRPFMKGRMR
jgi:hypothetical protein